MADDPVWRPLHAELERWTQAGRVADLWLRDDDAVRADRCARPPARSHRPPCDPGHVGGDPGACRRAACGAACPGAPASPSQCTAGRTRTTRRPARRNRSLERIARPASCSPNWSRAKAVIDRLFAGQAAPVLVPPWNRIDAALLPALAETGFAALSVFGRAKPATIPIVNTHVDIIDWHGGRSGKDHGGLVRELAAELRWRRETGSREPVGVLTHHLVHDEIAWLFLQGLFEATAGNPACRWASIRDLI